MNNIITLFEKNKKILIPIILIGLIAVPFFGLSTYVLRVFCVIFIYSMLTLSLNIITGYLGATSMGHAALFSVGAYAGAIVATRLGLNIWLSLLFAMLIGIIVGAFLGVCTMRLSGSYMTVTTLAFAQVVLMITKNWASVTNGTLGIRGIPDITVFGIELSLKNGGTYWFGLFLLLACIVFINLVIKSKYGRSFIAVRDDELGARMMGLNTYYYKVLATTLSGLIAAIAGCYYSFMIGYIDPFTFNFDMSMTILTMAIFGGLASIPGSIVGAGVLILFPEVLRFLNAYRFLFFGIILVLMMKFRPKGIFGGIKTKEYKLPKGVVCNKRNTRENTQNEPIRGDL